MTMHRDDGILDAGGVLPNAADQRAELVRRGIAHRIGDVDGAGARSDSLTQHLVEKLGIGAAGVLGRELDIVAQRAGIGHHLAGAPDNLFAGHPQLVLQVDIRRSDKDVDARPGRVFDRLPGGIHITAHAARQAADRRAAHFTRYTAHRIQVAGRRRREAGLDNVHPQSGKLPGDFDLFARIQRCARRLLAVAQCRIENNDTVLIHGSSLLLISSRLQGHPMVASHPRGWANIRRGGPPDAARPARGVTGLIRRPAEVAAARDYRPAPAYSPR